MIPITVGIIGSRDEDTSVGRAFLLSVTYVLGLSVVYSLLGLLVGLIGFQVRGFLAGPYVAFGVAVVFGVLALGMLGLYDLQLPSSVATRLNAIGGKGFAGVLLTGMVSGLVASPCTAAPLAGILALIAKQGDPLRGLLLLFTFAWGMGLLLIVVGTSAGALKRLPKSGAWMEDIKRLFGFAFIGVAAYFIRTYIPEPAYHLVLAGCLVAGGVAFGALDSLPAEPTTGARLKKGVGLVLAVLGLYLLVGTLWTRGVLLPAPVRTAAGTGDSTDGSPPPVAEVKWETDVQAALARAKAEDRRVLMQFTAEWCEYCKQMERESLPKAEVKAALAAYIPVRVDVTEPDAATDQLASKYDVLGPPVFLTVEGDGTEVARLDGYADTDALLAFLRDPEATDPEAEPGGT
jgi:thiol:disulfide interchange protein DsbD